MKIKITKTEAEDIKTGLDSVQDAFKVLFNSDSQPRTYERICKFIAIREAYESNHSKEEIKEMIETRNPKNKSNTIKRFLNDCLYEDLINDFRLNRLISNINVLHGYLDTSEQSARFDEVLKYCAPSSYIDKHQLAEALHGFEKSIAKFRMEELPMENKTSTIENIEQAINFLSDDYIAETIMNTLPLEIFNAVDYEQVEEWFDGMTLVSGDITTLQFSINKWEYDEPLSLIISVVKHAGENGLGSTATVVTVYYDEAEDKEAYEVAGKVLPTEALALHLQNLLSQHEVRMVTEEQKAIINQLLA